MTHLVIGCPPALALVQRSALLFDTGDDPLDGSRKVIEGDLAGIASRRCDRRFVDQIGQIGAGEAGCHPRYPVKVHVSINLDLSNVNLEDGKSSRLVRTIDQHLTIKAAGAEQCRVENLRPVGRSQENYACARVKSIELGEELIQRLLLLIVAAERAGRPAAAEGIELIHEDDAGRRLPCLFEQIAHPRRADPDEHLNELRSRYREEGYARLAGNRSRQQCLARSRRADQQNPLWNVRAQSAVALGILQKRDHLLQLELGLIDTRHVSESHLGIFFST
ncbi:hypothetical protein ACVWW1_003389 [Bradyrhizobium sp. JR3.5]